MDNLELYSTFASVPDNAKKQIGGGKLKGFTDINPMWRIKALTAKFGPCGIGWGYEITKQWLETGSKGEIAAFCNINLWYKIDGVKSEPIPGTGGSMFIGTEKQELRTSDECYKMALTDAISVACKAIGVGADVYWQADNTKYSKAEPEQEPETVDEAMAYQITFGKHKGKTLGEVWKTDIDYIRYLNGGEKTDATIKKSIKIIDNYLREQNGYKQG